MTPNEGPRLGGLAVLRKYGREHYARIGRLGALASRGVYRRPRADRESATVLCLRHRVRQGEAPGPSVREIARAYGYTKRQILSRGRTADLFACRVEIAVLMRQRGLTLSEIGRRLERHHTSVLSMLEVWRQATGEVL